MKKVLLSHTNQKGFSPIFIIVAVILVGVSVFFLKNSQKFTSESSQSPSQSETKVGTGLGKEEGDTYTFYYPSGYVKSQIENSEVLNYKNGSTKAVEPESIFLNIVQNSKRKAAPTLETCSKVAETFRKKSDDEIKSAMVLDTNNHGCKITTQSKIDGVNDSIVIVEKDLWNKTGNDYSIYSVRAVYYANASKDQAEQLNNAASQFTLK